MWEEKYRGQSFKILTKKEVNEKNGLSVETTPGGQCKSSGVTYTINCKKFKVLYIGETGKYDIKNLDKQKKVKTDTSARYKL